MSKSPSRTQVETREREEPHFRRAEVESAQGFERVKMHDYSVW